MLRFRLLVVSFVVLTACTDINGLDQVVITVAVTPDQIVPGDTATIVVRLTNPTASTVEVPVRCTSPFEIANAQGEIVVGNEAIPCFAWIQPPEVLRPFQSVERRATWTGYGHRLIDSAWVIEPVAPGPYRVYGRLEDRRSAPHAIEVVSAPAPQTLP